MSQTSRFTLTIKSSKMDVTLMPSPALEDSWFVESPTKVPITDVPIARVVCGADHSLALDLNGILYAWGMNNDGQCGVGRRSDVLVPERVVLPQQKSGQAGMQGVSNH